MWKESIGTVIGIVHARRIGVPVILVDPNFIDSPLLESISEDTVRDCESALNTLVRKIAPSLNQQLKVLKRNGKEVPFDQRKVRGSVKVACAQASVDDTVFPIDVCRNVYRTIMGVASNGRITTEEIKRMVFQELGRLALDRLAGPEVQKQAKRVQDAWEFREYEKHEVGNPARELETARREIEELSTALAEAERQRDELQAQIGKLQPPDGSQKPAASPEGTRTLLSTLTREFAGRQWLCIRSTEQPSFCAAFQRRGLSQEEFDRFFVEERHSPGKLSNLSANIDADLAKYPYVLYAWYGLRHHASAPNLITGAGPNDAVRRFIRRLEASQQ